jgi:RNA polymerase sigma-70 factor (ECF subfamily)
LPKAAVAAQSADDDALVARSAAGDGAALAVLVGRHGDRLAALARRMLGPDGDVEDVVQETFVRLWSRAGLWRPGEAQLATWLHRVAANLCIDRLRRRRAGSLDEAPEPIDPTPPPDRDQAAMGAARRIDEALAALAPRQRLAIVLCHYQELGNIEAAAAMAISVEALESLLARGRRALKAELAQDRTWMIAALAEASVSRLEEARHGERHP